MQARIAFGFFREKGMVYPPAGTPGGLMVMLAEYGTLSRAEVLAPSIDMAKGLAI